MWEIRIPTDTDPALGRARHRSFTFRGTEAEADAYRAELVATESARPLPPARLITVAERTLRLSKWRIIACGAEITHLACKAG